MLPIDWNHMIDWLATVDWTKVPPWLTPIIASAALIFTASSSRASRRSADAAHEQIRHRNRKDEEEQASKVAAWLVIRSNGGGNADDIDIYLRHVNRSQFPVYNFLVQFSAFPKLHLERRIIEPSDDIEECTFDRASETLKRIAGDAFSDYLKGKPLGDVPLNDSSALWPLFYYLFVEYLTERGLELQFRDSSNRVWSRLSTGELELAPIPAANSEATSMLATVIKEVETEIDSIHAEVGLRLKKHKTDT